MKLITLVLFLAATLSAATLKVGATEAYQTPCQAIYAAAAGDIIEIAPATYSGQDAVCFVAKPLTIRPSSGRVTLNARDASNRAWNVYGRGILAVELVDNTKTVDVSDIDFVGAAISEADGRNAAGIRVTKGNLKCVRCGFYYNQNGILTSSGSGKIEVIDSDFAFNGTSNGYEHNLYIQGTELLFTHSVTRNSWTGQAIKCRSPKCTIEYSLIGESKSATNGNTNVEIDVPNGGVTVIRGNLILQSTATANSHVISIGAEGTGVDSRMHSSTIDHNTIVGYRDPTIFFRHVSTSNNNNPNYPGPVVITSNVMAGKGTMFEGKQPTTNTANLVSEPIAPIFVGESSGDYHLAATVADEFKNSGAYPATPLAMEPPALTATPYSAPGTAAGFDKAPMPPPPPSEPPSPVTPTTSEFVGVISMPPNVTGAVVKNADGSYSVVLTKQDGEWRKVRQKLFGWLVK